MFLFDQNILADLKGQIVFYKEYNHDNELDMGRRYTATTIPAEFITDTNDLRPFKAIMFLCIAVVQDLRIFI